MRIIRVSLTSIQKETGRERTWRVRGEKICFSSAVKKRRKRNTLKSVLTGSHCVKKQFTSYFCDVNATENRRKNNYFKDIIVAVLL